ncbi:DUF4041 domain-containing protein [Streptomyces sp. NPDC017988]|uniref:DUF4041 domain-containing protein n=1 Tax=Streptomyces sp. NPDC017988 TaxID=3365025 RepID=UPI003787543F
MIRDFSKLMLRAYNAEADYAVRTMRPHRLTSLVDRLYKSRETIGQARRHHAHPHFRRLPRRPRPRTAADSRLPAEEERGEGSPARGESPRTRGGGRPTRTGP